MIIPRLAACVAFGAALLVAGCETPPSAETRAATALAPLSAGSLDLPARNAVIEMRHADRPPVPRLQRPPRAPLGHQPRGTGAEAVVDFLVGPDGNVYNAFAMRATHPEFGAAAVEAVVQWRFTPGTKNGQLAWIHMQVPIVFSLD